MTKKILLIILASLIFVFIFTLQLFLAKDDSQTTDEGVHLSAGYTYLTKKDFRFNPEHPPLVKYLAASPLLLAELNTPHDNVYYNPAWEFFYDSWREARKYGEDLLYDLSNNADRILLLSRIPMIFLTLMLGFVIFYISSKMWGKGGGVLSLILFALEPIVLAHGHLVTTDIAISFGYLLCIFLLWKFLNNNSWKNLVLFGLALGVTQLFKFTAIVLLPGAVVLLIYFSIANKNKFKLALKNFGKLIIAFVIAWIVIWAGYMFKVNPVPINTSTEKTTFISSIAQNKYFKYIKPFSFPRDYYKGLTIVLGHTQVGHDSFLLGQHSKTGWWYYFPVVFSAKTSITLLVFLFLSMFLIFKDKKSRPLAIFLLISGLIFLLFAMLSKANLGVRHIMPVYAIIFVLCGALAKYLSRNFVGKALIVILIGFLIYENYKIFPNYISYYNQLYSGSDNGYKVATDSNYDWGQDLKRIGDYVRSNNLKDYSIEYSWDSDKALTYYGLSTKKYLADDKTSKYLIIGATVLNNQPYSLLQSKPIYARITPSVFVYEINNDNAK